MGKTLWKYTSQKEALYSTPESSNRIEDTPLICISYFKNDKIKITPLNTIVPPPQVQAIFG